MHRRFSVFYKGCHPKYIWKDGVVGGIPEFVGHFEESESWMALFLDLLYVAMLSKLTDMMDNCYRNFEMFLICFCLLFLFFRIRNVIDEYAVRFFEDDVFHRMFYFIYTCGILVMVMNMDFYRNETIARRILSSSATSTIPSKCSIDAFFFSGYTYGFYITQLSVIGLYFTLMYIDKTRRVYEQFIVRNTLMLCLSIVLLIGNLTSTTSLGRVITLATVSLLEFFFLYIPTILHYAKKNGYLLSIPYYFHFPLNFLDTQDRAGSFILVVLGECVIIFLHSAWPSDEYINVYLVNLFGLALLFCYAFAYFDHAQVLDKSQHAARRNMWAGIIFFQLHIIVSFFVMITAQGIIDAAASARGNNANTSNLSSQFMLALGCSVTSMTILIMKALHKGIKAEFETIESTIHFFFICSISVIHILIYWCTYGTEIHVVLHATAILLGLILDIIITMYKGHSHPSAPNVIEEGMKDEDGNHKKDDEVPYHHHQHLQHQPQLQEHKGVRSVSFSGRRSQRRQESHRFIPDIPHEHRSQSIISESNNNNNLDRKNSMSKHNLNGVVVVTEENESSLDYEIIA